MNAVVIDDDPLSCDLLRDLLSRVAPTVCVIAQAGTIQDAKAVLVRNDYDLVFLDIQLIGGSGFDLVPVVRPAARIIFVTGFDDHAVRAFELNALDYIVKPVTGARIEAALRRLNTVRITADASPQKFSVADTIFLKGAASGGRFAAVRDIMAILSSENYSEVLLGNGERWLVRRTMQAWMNLLPPESFVQVHRTTIVNVAFVERIDRTMEETGTLLLRGVRQVFPVSRRRWPALRARTERADPT